MRVFQGLTGYSTDVIDRTARDLGFSSPRWFQEVRNSRAFVAGSAFTAGAGLFPHVQLINPVGSAVTLIVYRITLTSATAGEISINEYDTALTNLDKTGRNVLLGGAAAVGQVRTQDNAAELGTEISPTRISTSITNSLGDIWQAQLGAGRGLVVVHRTVATRLFANFWWLEV